jgi:hypothetical protein
MTGRIWLQGGVEAVPPVALSALAATLVAGGLAWWLVWMAFQVVAWIAWLPVIDRLPWRRRERELNRSGPPAPTR